MACGQGEVELPGIQSVGLTDTNLEIRTANRTYFLIADSVRGVRLAASTTVLMGFRPLQPAQAEDWATKLSTQQGVPLDKAVTPLPVIASMEAEEACHVTTRNRILVGPRQRVLGRIRRMKHRLTLQKLQFNSMRRPRW